ncbi:hypothetical protein [Leptospira noguchii]|uniref:hypothetical protein n=1 Tax=Leptospira noguchii TaxID=28182 RepID=UPI000773BF3B|nr:hypothetical protein [Leptospira noguchii]
MEYTFEGVLNILISRGYTIDWETPYEISVIPDDLCKLKDMGSIIAKYWIRGTEQKSLKSTQISNGLMTKMVLCRTILPSVRMKLEDFEFAKVIKEKI